MTPIDHSARQRSPFTFNGLPPLEPWKVMPAVPPPILGQRIEFPVLVLPPLSISPSRGFEIISASQMAPPQDLVQNRFWSVEARGLPVRACPFPEPAFTAPALSLRDLIKPANYQELRLIPSRGIAEMEAALNNDSWHQSSLETLRKSWSRLPQSPPRSLFTVEERLFAVNPAAFFLSRLQLTSPGALTQRFSAPNSNLDFHQPPARHQYISPRERLAVLGADGKVESYPLLDALSPSSELRMVMAPDTTSAKTSIVNTVVGLYHNAQRGLAHIGLESMGIDLRERAGILESMGKSQERTVAILQERMRRSTIISPPRHLADRPSRPCRDVKLLAPYRGSENRDLVPYGPRPQPNGGPYPKIDYLQSYDVMRFDPHAILQATSINDLVPKMGVFFSNMVIRGEKAYHPFSGSFESKCADLVRLFNKVATLDKSGIIASFLFNGINVWEKEFGEYVDLRSKSFDGQVLTIGSYNRSYGLNWDFTERIPDEFLGRENFSTEQMRNQLAFASKACDLLGPDYYCTFELHSEATLQYFNAFARLGPAQKELVSKHILVIALGGIRPIPKNFGLQVSNIYSRDDIAFKNYGKSFLDDPEYTIKVVDSLVPKKQQPYIIGDHAYLGETYKVNSRDAQNKLDENFHYLKFKE